MNRIDRLTAILTHLQSKRLTKAQEIADRFQISLRTVYRDIRALEEAGVPLIGEAGQGYSLVEGYRLPPVMFTQEEAQAFVVAEKILEKFSDKGSSEHFHSALMKIKSVLKSQEKERVNELSPLVAVYTQKNQLLHSGKDQFLRMILEALSSKKLISINYTTFDKEETSERTLEGVGIYYAFDQWYLIAWCQLRKDYRTFRLDRINWLQILSDDYNPQAHPSLKEYIDKVRSAENLIEVKIEVPLAKEKYLKTQKYNHGFVMESREKDKITMTFMTSHIEGFVRWMITMADMVQIISPPEAKDRILELIEEVKVNQSEK